MMKLKSKKMASNILLGLLTVGCTTALAAEKDMPSYSLDPMLVTASRYETREVEIPAATEVFTQEKIQQLGANNVMEVVKNVPGFTLTASPTGNTYIGFRGMKRHYVAILVNGIMLNQDGNYDLESISTDIIDRIEVVKGGSAVLYGSSASAGVINIITKKDVAQNKILLAGGDQHKFKGSASVATDRLQVSYNHFQGRDMGETYRNKTSRYLCDEVDRDSVNIQYQFNDNLQMQYMHSEKQTICTKTPSGGFDSSIKYNFGQLHYNNNELLATLYLRDREWDYSSIGSSVPTYQKGKNMGFDVQNKWELGKTTLTAGLVYDYEDTENKKHIAAAKRDSGAVFFMTENKLSDKTTLMLGARESYVEESGSEFCPQLQLLHKLGEDDNIYLNVNRSMRAPNVSEQWATDSQVMSPDLKAENGWNYEIGWKKRLSPTELVKVNIFKMDVNDRIYRDKVKSGPDAGMNIYLNADKYRNTGVELSYEKGLSDKFTYNVGLSFADPEQKTRAGKWEEIEYKFGANAGLGYYIGKTSANLVLNYMGDRNGDAEQMIDINMNLSHAIDDHSKVRLAVYNLLDRDDVRSGDSSDNTGSILGERNWLLSYEYTF